MLSSAKCILMSIFIVFVEVNENNLKEKGVEKKEETLQA